MNKIPETESRVRNSSTGICLRKPVAEDGIRVNRFIFECAPLDRNSVYCNLLQCTHFADTCVIAEQDGEVVGFTSAYLIPGRHDTLFIWQIAVDESIRGQGLATTMLKEILLRPQCSHLCAIEASVAPENEPSRKLFRNLADELQARCTDTLWFERGRHFAGQHPDERLISISTDNIPFARRLASPRR